jgi:hypothetical protein
VRRHRRVGARRKTRTRGDEWDENNTSSGHKELRIARPSARAIDWGRVTRGRVCATADAHDARGRRRDWHT